jgi:hypothetical protein
MKTKRITWGETTWELYTPKVNQKRRSILGSLILADIVLPMTFGVGIMISKLILKLNPMYLYR